MTREQITTDYDVQSGIIRSCGTFEGEAIYVPFYWDAYLNGFADGDDGHTLTFRITPEDRAMFPEIPSRKRVIRLVQRDDGFVCEV